MKSGLLLGPVFFKFLKKEIQNKGYPLIYFISRENFSVFLFKVFLGNLARGRADVFPLTLEKKKKIIFSYEFPKPGIDNSKEDINLITEKNKQLIVKIIRIKIIILIRLCYKKHVHQSKNCCNAAA